MTFDFESLAYKAIHNMTKEDALITLFEFLRDNISFDRAICTSANRKDKISYAYMEYASDKSVSQYTYKKNIFLESSKIEELAGKDFSKVAINNNVESTSDLSKLFRESPYEVMSFLNIPLYMSEDKNHLIYVLLVSRQKDQFTEAHRYIAQSLRVLFQELALAFYFENPNTNTIFFFGGSDVTTFEMQIRNCPDLKNVMQNILDVAPYDSTVLIHGETGSGKEIVAETIHSLSVRIDKPFIRVNCAAIPETLIESEFFGYEKGSFTGAVHARKGYFEQANKGTIYLDEIGELSQNAQVRLLRVLENREVTRIGSEKSIKLDLRIIVATNKNLWTMVEEKTFREDLYYRLYVYPIIIPPLRERKRDIPILLQYFYSYFVQKMKLKNPPCLTEKNVYQLLHYHWPGNIRELRHSVERSLLMNSSKVNNELDFSFLPTSLESADKEVKHTKEEIEKVLKLANGRIQGRGGAAEILRINPSTLRSRMKALKIPYTKKEFER